MTPVTSMASALHRCLKLWTLFPAQCVMEFRQKCGDRLADQISVERDHEDGCCVVSEFDDAMFVDGDNRRGTRFNQNAHSLLGRQSQPAVAQDFRNEQSGADERQRFETGADGGIRRGQIAEPLAEQRASDPHQGDCPLRQKPRSQHDGKQIEKPE